MLRDQARLWVMPLDYMYNLIGLARHRSQYAIGSEIIRSTVSASYQQYRHRKWLLLLPMYHKSGWRCKSDASIGLVDMIQQHSRRADGAVHVLKHDRVHLRSSPYSHVRTVSSSSASRGKLQLCVAICQAIRLRKGDPIDTAELIVFLWLQLPRARVTSNDSRVVHCNWYGVVFNMIVCVKSQIPLR